MPERIEAARERNELRVPEPIKTRVSEQVRGVLKVEGYPGLWRRVRRLLF